MTPLPEKVAADHARYLAEHVWGDEVPLKVMCDTCREHFDQDELDSVEDGTPLPLFLCARCARDRSEAEMEPECSCRQIDVDLLDAHGCEVHDSDSAWNVSVRAASSRHLHQQEVA